MQHGRSRNLYKARTFAANDMGHTTTFAGNDITVKKTWDKHACMPLKLWNFFNHVPYDDAHMPSFSCTHGHVGLYTQPCFFLAFFVHATHAWQSHDTVWRKRHAVCYASMLSRKLYIFSCMPYIYICIAMQKATTLFTQTARGLYVRAYDFDKAAHKS